MKNFYRIMPGAKSIYAKECHEGGFIGVDWFDGIDLSHRLPDDWRKSNRAFIPIYLEEFPKISKETKAYAKPEVRVRMVAEKAFNKV